MITTPLIKSLFANFQTVTLKSTRNQATQKIVRFKRIRNSETSQPFFVQEPRFQNITPTKIEKFSPKQSKPNETETKWKAIKVSTEFTIVGKDDAGLRLDRFIKKIVDIPQSLLEKLLRKKRVLHFLLQIIH